MNWMLCGTRPRVLIVLFSQKSNDIPACADYLNPEPLAPGLVFDVALLPFSPSPTVSCTAKVTKTITVHVLVSVKPETCRRLPGSRDYYEVNYAAQRGHVRANLDVSLSALWNLPWGLRATCACCGRAAVRTNPVAGVSPWHMSPPVRKRHSQGFRSSMTHRFRTTGMPPHARIRSWIALLLWQRIPSSLTRSRLRYGKPATSADCPGSASLPFGEGEGAFASEAEDGPSILTFPKLMRGRKTSSKRSVSENKSIVCARGVVHTKEPSYPTVLR
jgi:hypothetical protein